MGKELTCCFTGHRPQKLGFSEDSPEGTSLKNRISGAVIRLIEEQNVRHFISGMALGTDTYAAESVLKLKEVYPDITLECAVPCRGQSARWRAADKKRYSSILAAADKVTVLQEEYTPFCMKLRDAYMADHADIVLAVWNGSDGGTSYTIKYARERGKTLFIIPVIENNEGSGSQCSE